MREIWIVVLGILGLIYVGAESATTLSHQLVAEAKTELQITQDDRALGNPAAPITIVEYASLGCPHCAHFTNDVLPELKKAWIDTGKAKLVLRDFPLDEPSLRAAMIARCAPPDRFYAFADTFFASQEIDVNATPTFFINGSKFSGAPTAEEFNRVLSGLAEKS